MAKYNGPKNRLARREGQDVSEKGSASLQRRLNVPPGVHGPKGAKKLSDYGRQLREKQKAKRIYGLLERQFRKYFDQAIKVKGKTGEALLQSLERRLDNIVYRLGFTPSRTMARQLVSHGHVLVNGKRVNIPSYNVSLDQLITLGAKAIAMPTVKKLLDDAEGKVPSYLEKKAAAGRLIKIPSREEIPTEVNEQLIIEYYSR
jgi:small subunit ribosomal protein S4